VSAFHDFLGPDLERLLLEAASDPRSQLLRAPRPARVEDLFERQSVLRPSATGLSNLDRHLLAVHRAELAELLLRGCDVLLSEDGEARLRVHRCKDVIQDREFESWDGLAENARSFPDLPLARESVVDGRRIVLALAGCVTDESKPSLTRLALAANRLQPSSRAMAWVGFDQALHDQDATAVRVLNELLTHCATLEAASASLANLGMAYSNLGRYAEACRAYRTSFERDPTRATALVGWLHYAIQSGAAEEARAAARILDEVVRAPRATFLELLRSYDERRRIGRLDISDASRTTARKVASAAGSVSGRIIDVYV
jgi:tetratricopeptide (TPR) repeat protein